MHPNPAFHNQDPELARMLVDAVGFGMIVAPTPDGVRVAHTPLVAPTPDRIRFHVARNNAIAPHLEGASVLVVVNGPHAYVSPRWYEQRRAIPTWNYVALELEGTVSALSREDLAELLGEIGARNEARLGGDDPWRPAHVPADMWHENFQSIEGFELAVTARRTTFKLSQNRSPEDRARVADALSEQGAHDLAQLMRGVDLPPPEA